MIARDRDYERWSWIVGTAWLAVVCIAGCSGAQSRLSQPSINDDAGQAAVEQYDASGDGTIDGDELAKVPALRATLTRVDTDGDGKVSGAEIDVRIAAWQKSAVALTRVTAIVRQNGSPVSGAQVMLVPESFLGPAVKPAHGVTDPSGAAHLRISQDPDEAGVHLGYYRAQVSKQRADGTEAIPARYNSETELGAEITPDDPNAGRLVLELGGR